MTDTSTTTDQSAAERLAERLRSTTVDDVRDTHAQAYRRGENFAAERHVDELDKLSALYRETVEGEPIAEIDADAIVVTVEAITGTNIYREYDLDGRAQVAAFLLGVVETYDEATDLL